MTQVKQTKNKKANNKYKIAGLVTLILLIAVTFLLKKCTVKPKPSNPPGNLSYDPNAVEGGWDEADTNKIIEDLNKKVEESEINISMNTSPIFADGKSDGNLMIVNETCNRYPQIIQIIRNDTQELIYESGGVPVGSKIKKAKLNKELPKGVYECTAIFNSADPQTGNFLGKAGAIIRITVLA